jgi:pimeloyl-ACP methyl ester carboxylesterase
LPEDGAKTPCADRRPDVALVTIPDATHFMIVEQPGWIAARILELAGVEATASTRSGRR